LDFSVGRAPWRELLPYMSPTLQISRRKFGSIALQTTPWLPMQRLSQASKHPMQRLRLSDAPPMALRVLPAFSRTQRSTLANALQASALAGAADLTVQVTCNKPQEIGDLNLQRVISYSMFGLLYAGGFQVVLYRRFDQYFGMGSAMRQALVKVAADCPIHAPFIYIPSFYLITGMVQGLGFSGSLTKLRDNYNETMQCYLMLWAVPMFVLFRCVPARYRVLFLASGAFFEKCVYSLMEQRS